jgi:hypothetical protein
MRGTHAHSATDRFRHHPWLWELPMCPSAAGERQRIFSIKLSASSPADSELSLLTQEISSGAVKLPLSQGDGAAWPARSLRLFTWCLITWALASATGLAVPSDKGLTSPGEPLATAMRRRTPATKSLLFQFLLTFLPGSPAHLQPQDPTSQSQRRSQSNQGRARQLPEPDLRQRGAAVI